MICACHRSFTKKQWSQPYSGSDPVFHRSFQRHIHATCFWQGRQVLQSPNNTLPYADHSGVCENQSVIMWGASKKPRGPTHFQTSTSLRYNHYNIANATPQRGVVSASITRAMGSAMRTNNEQFEFAYRHTTERGHSAIIIGAPTFISFV